MSPRAPGTAGRLAVYYAVFGGTWILLSDRLLLSWLTDTRALTAWQTWKGWAFVAASAVFIYAIVRRELLALARVETALRDSTARHHGMFQDSPVALIEMDYAAVRARAAELHARGIADLRPYCLEHPAEARACAALVRVRGVNRAAQLLYDARSEQELRDGLRLVLEEEPSETLLEQLHAVAEGTTALELEAPLRTLRGRERTVVMHWAVSPGSEQTFERVVVSMIDVTETREAEGELARHRQELARAGRVLALGDLSSSMAHELKQPLAAIRTNAQAARRLLDAEPPDLAEVRRALDDIEQDDERADDIIRQLRAFIRRREIAREPVDINAVIREAERLLRTEARSRRVAAVVRLEPDLPLVTGDPVALRQVLLNLILNALDAAQRSPAGRRCVVVTTAREPDGQVAVTVRDSGPPLPPGLAARLFEPFFTTKADGLGLGLTLSRSLIEAHGGTLWADGEPEGGMTFGFRLPGRTAAA
ncbi:MAG: sensor histidine kinase [Candidatus Krumholzibacteriia bacterium]